MAKNKGTKEWALNTYTVLTEGGFSPSQPLTVRKVLVTSEQGRKYTLEISDNKRSALFDVDGNIIKNGAKCDKLILVSQHNANNEENWIEIFVELKGKDIAHAIEQLRETLQHPIFTHPSNKKIKARIVAVSFPSNKANPIMEKAKAEFIRKPFFCELKGMKNGQKDII